MKIKMFACDLDGTLLDGHSKISRRSADMIRCAQKNGKQFLAATGRAWSSVQPLMDKAGVSFGAVLLNGAEYRTGEGNVVLREYMEKKTAQDILSVLAKNNIAFEAHTERGDFVSEEGQWPHAGARILKFFIVCHDPMRRETIKETAGRMPGLYIASSAPWNIEITSEHATKEAMLERVGRLYGITGEETAVFGDGENDKPMLLHFHHSFAMGNAPDDVKRCAASVIGSNEEDGVAEQIGKML